MQVVRGHDLWPGNEALCRQGAGSRGRLSLHLSTLQAQRDESWLEVKAGRVKMWVPGGAVWGRESTRPSQPASTPRKSAASHPTRPSPQPPALTLSSLSRSSTGQPSWGCSEDWGGRGVGPLHSRRARGTQHGWEEGELPVRSQAQPSNCCHLPPTPRQKKDALKALF